MMNCVKENPLFNEMLNYCKWHESREKALKSESEEVVGKYGWESEEMTAVQEKLKALKTDPYGAGAWKAWRAVYWNKNEKNPDELCVTDFCWENEIPQFVETLRKFGITEFVTVDASTALMRTIHGLVDCGCTLVGLATVDEKKCWCDKGEDPYEHRQGLRFSL